MDFIEYTNAWANKEVRQGRIMIGLGFLTLLAFYFSFQNENHWLRGAVIPLGLLLVVLIGYGGYILYSRPAHARASIARFQNSKEDAIEKEKAKHINDNKSGKMLLRYVYPGLMLISVLVSLLIPDPYYKGMAVGFILLFASTYIMDNGFVTRSDAFLSFLDSNKL